MNNFIYFAFLNLPTKGAAILVCFLFFIASTIHYQDNKPAIVPKASIITFKCIDNPVLDKKDDQGNLLYTCHSNAKEQ